MSVWGRVNEARQQEGICAALGVRDLQSGYDPSYFFTRAGQWRAEAYDYLATAKILKPLLKSREVT